MKTFKSFVKETAFTNEIGNKISIVAKSKPISNNTSGIYFAITGPNSKTTDHITDKEAETLYKEIGKVLNMSEQKKKANTPFPMIQGVMSSASQTLPMMTQQQTLIGNGY